MQARALWDLPSEALGRYFAAQVQTHRPTEEYTYRDSKGVSYALGDAIGSEGLLVAFI